MLHKYLRPEMTVYDIGANIGFFSLLAGRLVGATGRVTAFGADPGITAPLRENGARNQGVPISVEEKRRGLLQVRYSSLARAPKCRRIEVWDTLSTMEWTNQRPARSESKL
jgi:FkbM family methyltransferase